MQNQYKKKKQKKNQNSYLTFIELTQMLKFDNTKNWQGY